MVFLSRLFWSLLALVLLALAAAVIWLYQSLPQTSGELRLEQISEPVTVRRDRRGVPHIIARTSDDAYFALGYVHAQDRLWQMELNRRAGAGRLAELFGPKALKSDRFMRTMGYYASAKRQLGTLDAEVVAALDAYADGINAWIDSHRSPWQLPPEFQLLNHRPENWQPADSLVWLRLMATRLSGNWRDELLRARLAKTLDTEQLADLWPDVPPDTAATLSWLRDAPAVSLEDIPAIAGTPPGAPRGASNAWAVAGSHTRSGSPVLANDPHLGYRAPILWYLARITAPGMKLAGGTVPGLPFTVLGHNERIAWGLTATHTDLQDLFVEKIDPSDAGRYLTPDGNAAFVTREETIKVRGGADETVTVRISRHGPVISDALTDLEDVLEEGHVLALATTFLDPEDKTPQGLYFTNRAQNWNDIRQAVRDLFAPQMNMMYADVDGNIGFISPGRVPIRRSGRGWMPKPGWTGEADWTGFIPFEELPVGFNPESGHLINANNRNHGPDYPHFITEDWELPYRADRIAEMLARGGSQSANTGVRMQRDVISTMAREMLPLMTTLEGADACQRTALKMLREWDARMAADRAEPLIFNAWMRQLVRHIAEDELGELFAKYWTLRPDFVHRVLTQRKQWCDDTRTPDPESCEKILGRSFTATMNALQRDHGTNIADWKWGDEHVARFDHPLSRGILSRPLLQQNEQVLAIARRLLDRWLNVVVPADGGNYTVGRAAMFVYREDQPFASRHGAGLRAVYDFSDLAKSSFMIATGQSGNLLSSHYRDLVEHWRNGRAFPLERLADQTLKMLPK